MTDSVKIWMPFYIGDYLADTSHFDATAHGVYVLLIMHYWRTGPLPTDEDTLKLISRCPGDAWSIAWAKVKPMFHVADGQYHHKRIDREYAEASRKRKNAHEKALVAARARWKENEIELNGGALQDASSNPSGNASGIRLAVLEQCPSPSPAPALKTTEAGASVVAAKRLGGDQKIPVCPHKAIISLYGEILPTAAEVKAWTKANDTALRTRWKETCVRLGYTTEQEGVEWFRKLFVAISESDFLMGRKQTPGREPFYLRLAWIVNAANFAKIVEGAYWARAA